MQLFGSAALGQAKSKAAGRGVELPESFRSGFLLKLQLSDSWTRRKRSSSSRNPSIRGSYYIPPTEKKTEPESSSVLPQLQGNCRVAKQSPEPRADPRGPTGDTAPPAFSSFSSSPAPGDAELPVNSVALDPSEPFLKPAAPTKHTGAQRVWHTLRSRLQETEGVEKKCHVSHGDG